MNRYSNRVVAWAFVFALFSGLAQADSRQAGTDYAEGLRYATGNGVPQDLVRAAQAYQRAAKQGHDIAQYNLGLFYETGRGVSVNKIEAVRWYQRAAAAGNANAATRLKVMIQPAAYVKPTGTLSQVASSATVVPKAASVPASETTEARDSRISGEPVPELADIPYTINEGKIPSSGPKK